jgi:uncharacterized protein (DUF305 family)
MISMLATPSLSVLIRGAGELTAFAGCTNDMSEMSGMDHGSSSPASPTARSTSGTTAASGDPAAGTHNNADVMFAQMMIPHHQQAIQMSDIILVKDGINSGVSELAQQIKDAQAPEIGEMSGWLAGRGQNPQAERPQPRWHQRAGLSIHPFPSPRTDVPDCPMQAMALIRSREPAEDVCRRRS